MSLCSQGDQVIIQGKIKATSVRTKWVIKNDKLSKHFTVGPGNEFILKELKRCFQKHSTVKVWINDGILLGLTPKVG